MSQNALEAVRTSVAVIAASVESVATAAVLDPQLTPRNAEAVLSVLRAGLELIEASSVNEIHRGSIDPSIATAVARAKAVARHAIRVLNAMHGPRAAES